DDDAKPFDPMRLARNLQEMGTNTASPFRFKPYDLPIADLPGMSDEASFVFSDDGDTLMVAQGDVTAWKLPTKWKRQLPWKFQDSDTRVGNDSAVVKWSVPAGRVGTGGVQQMVCGGGPEGQLLLVSVEKTLRVDVGDGRLVDSPRMPALEPDEDIVSCKAARDENHFFMTTDRGRVFALLSDSKAWVDSGVRISFPFDIGVNPDGTGFLSWVDGSALTVWLTDGKATASSTAGKEEGRQPSMIWWPENGRFWGDGTNIYSDSGACEVGEATKLFRVPRSVWRPVQVWSQRAQAYSVMSGGTALGLRHNARGRIVWCLWDMNNQSGGNSFPTELINASDLKPSQVPTVAVSADSSRFAYVDPAQGTPGDRRLVVRFRLPWQRDYEFAWESWCWSCMQQDRGEDFEMVGRYLLSLPSGWYCGKTRQGLYALMVSTIGEKWSALERQADRQRAQVKKMIGQDGKSKSEPLVVEWQEALDRSQSTLDKMQRWLERGSVTAKLAGAQRDIAYGFAARGGGWGYQVSRSGYETLQERCKRARKVCDEVMQQSRPPMVAFRLSVIAHQGLSVPHAEAESVIRRGVLLYPACSSLHGAVATWLLPRWGGSYGDVGAFLNASTVTIKSPQIRDEVYARVAVALSQQFSNAPADLFKQTGISLRRTQRGAASHLKRNPCSRDWVLSYSILANATRDPEAMERANRNYRTRFLYVKDSRYQANSTALRGIFENRPKLNGR
ncbi:MAG: hypothetical protein AAGA03_15660, partial [Planctomycetota bacterium]